MTRTPAALVLVTLLALGACGGGDGKGDGTDAAKAGPSDTPSATTSSTAPVTGAAAPSPVTGPTAKDFPAADVPVIGDAAVVEGAQAAEGRKGWVVRSELAQPSQDCFDDAVQRLVDAGFTKQGQVQVAGNHQAQLTNDEYAIIVSANDLLDGRCAVVYSVGQVGR